MTDDEFLDAEPVLSGELPDGNGIWRLIEIDGTYYLWWSDCVANDWDERYPSIALALLRLAVLCECATTDRHFFAHQFAEFAVRGQDFLHEETR